MSVKYIPAYFITILTAGLGLFVACKFSGRRATCSLQLLRIQQRTSSARPTAFIVRRKWGPAWSGDSAGASVLTRSARPPQLRGMEELGDPPYHRFLLLRPEPG